MELNYKKVESFLKAPVPQDIEDEILGAYATYSLERDMRSEDLRNYFESLQLPRELYKMVGKSDLTVEGTDVVDFERLLRCTYHLLVFMDNEQIIDEMWGLLVQASGRDQSFPNVKLRDHVLSIKDLQKVSNFVGIDRASGIVEMISCATSGKRVYMTYLDFAYVMGKLGYLRF